MLIILSVLLFKINKKLSFINPCAEKYYIFSVIYECTNITFLKIDINSIKFKNMRLV